jgi:iron complex outermembrane receptor protein
LKQIVSHTVEGLGTKELKTERPDGSSAFRATNNDDIRHTQSGAADSFQNVGSTRRQGIEAEVNIKSNTLQLYASYAFVDARFLDALQVGSNSPFAVDGNVQILPESTGHPAPSRQGRFRIFDHRRLQGWRGRCS